MAAAVGSNNIYPPIVTPFSPNFVIGSDEGCRVYFSISAYNSFSEYKDIHITVTRQSDNITALNKTKYPSQIKIMSVKSLPPPDSKRKSNDKYYITLTNDDIEGGFQTGIVYKVQMRFSNDASGLYSTPQKLDAYLSSHLSAFSEWSQVSLVQGIDKPELQIKNGKGGYLSSEETNIFNIDTLEIVGTFIADDVDPLRQYQLTLIDGKGNIKEQTEILFPDRSAENQLNYVFRTALQDGESYTLSIYYMTSGLYENTINFPIFTIINPLEQLHVNIAAVEDADNGRIGIHVTTDSIAPFSGIVTIRRTDSKSNFELWDDIHTVELRAEKIDVLWYDYTVESGIWYKYCIQKRDAAGNRGIVTVMEEPAMIIFDDIFLSSEDGQIKVRFNPQISSFQTVVSDTKVDTLGSKYPSIRRNGATYYRQFPLGGLITFLMDEENIFVAREEYYGESVNSLYTDYNKKNRIDIFNDITYERHFREKVQDFLYKHNVKLFRSATEGNILVKLMDIQFQPNATLGRRIYSFTCTCVEVDSCDLYNIDYYNIQKLVEEETNVDDLYTNTSSHIGQWDAPIPANQEFIHSSPKDGLFSVLEEYYNKDKKLTYILNVDSLDYLKIEMQDEPYLILDSGTGGVSVYNDTPTGISLAAAAPNGTLYMGYIAYINGKTIVIPKDGIYELKGKDIKITSLKFAKDTAAEIQYHVNIFQEENVSEVLSVTNFTTRIGQQWGGFIPGQSLFNDLWKKYYMQHPDDYYQALVSINGIRVQANPGTVVYVREDKENDVDRHIIGSTESIDFFDPDSVIGDAYFTGLHFEQATDYELERDILPEGKCNITDVVVDNLDKIENPQDRNVYYLQIDSALISLFSVKARAAVMAAAAPRLAKLTTAKGLPIFYIKSEDGSEDNIAIIDKADIEELETYLRNINYKIYITSSILFTDDVQIKVAEPLDEEGEAFEFILDNEENKTKLAAFKVILNQYGDKQITAALKRQIWKDINYTVSDYYIYYNDKWFVFDEESQDAVCPVPASIDYVCETMKAYYRTSESV